MTLSVVVVNWNTRDPLRDCLRSVTAHMRLSDDEWELIVVDNASSDGSVEMILREFPRAAVVANERNEGFGAANNRAFGRTRGRYVLLLNPDTVVHGAALDSMLRVMEGQPGIGALGCRLLNSDGSFQTHSMGHVPGLGNLAFHFLSLSRVVPRVLQPAGLYASAEPPAGADMEWISAACLLLRREALGDRIFDDRYFLYCEDIDLCERLRQSGWRVVYTPEAEVTHHDGRGFRSASPDIQMNKIRSVRKFMAQRGGAATRWGCDLTIVAGFLMRAGAACLMPVLRPSPARAARRALMLGFLRDSLRHLGAAGEL